MATQKLDNPCTDISCACYEGRKMITCNDDCVVIVDNTEEKLITRSPRDITINVVRLSPRIAHELIVELSRYLKEKGEHF